MSVRAGHGHEVKGLEEIEGRDVILHLQDHIQEGLRKCGLEAKLSPLVSAFLV